MSAQLRPGEQFPLTWNVSDPTDTSTYYPVAVVKRSDTNAILAIKDLLNVGGNLYQSLWQVPTDSSGLGFWVNVTVTAYTDAGHTTVSQNYQQENAVYLVQERVNRALGANYGGGGNEYEKIDYELIKNLIEEQILKIEFPQYPKFPKIEFPIVEKPKELERIKVIEEVMGHLGDAIAFNNDNIRKEMSDFSKKVEEHLTGITTETSTMGVKHSEILGLVKEYADQMQKYADKRIEEYMKQIRQELADRLDGLQVIKLQGEVVEKKEQKKDYLKLAQSLV